MMLLAPSVALACTCRAADRIRTCHGEVAVRMAVGAAALAVALAALALIAAAMAGVVVV